MRARTPTKILLVEDCAALRRSLERFLTGCGYDVFACDAAGDACRRLGESSPDLVILDYQLSDGTCVEVLDSVDATTPIPATIVISGEALPEQVFAIALRGVRRFLSKPVNPERLLQCIGDALTSAPNLKPYLRASVGHVPVRSMEQEVRAIMLKEALARSQGNRRAAARLLDVSRELLQHMLRRQTQ